MSSANPSHALVIGAGLAGAACAYALSQRGWQVTVLEQGSTSASGASGLPVGLVAPHTSADDTRISQITRVGIRHTLHRAAALLQEGQDWAATGVLEHCVGGRLKLPARWADAASAAQDAGVARGWSTPAGAAHIAAAHLPPSAVAQWHGGAAWLKPPALVAAMLAQPGIALRTQQMVARMAWHAPTQTWQALDAAAQPMASAPVLVLAAGFASAALLADCATFHPAVPLPLNPLRGQVAWGWMDEVLPPPDARGAPDASHAPHAPGQHHAAPTGLPPLPVNGKGSMATGIPYQTHARHGQIWMAGSTFTRGDTCAAVRAADMPDILAKLRLLHPLAAHTLQPVFDSGHAHAWAGVRATLPDRLPAVGAWPGLPGVHVCCGMGARGLALSVLAGDMLAAQLAQAPLPLPPHLAGMLDAGRWLRKAQRAQRAGR